MAEVTSIEWTDATFNPWWGCQKVSPACDHCYAERDSKRFAPGRVLWGVGSERRTFGDAHWAAPLKWAKTMPAKLGRRPRVFSASMGDWLDLDAPLDQFVRLLDTIRRTPELDWLLLSKRIGNWRKRLEQAWQTGGDAARSTWLGAWLDGTPPAHVWLGATVVTQEEADRDVPKLLAVPARVRFLSIEPMLGRVDLRRWLWQCCGDMQPGNDHGMLGQEPERCCGNPEPRDALHWIICGGESGPYARPMHPDWARSLRDQCAAAGVEFMFKQWGEWAPGSGFNLKPRAWIDRAGRLVTEASGDVFPKGATSADGWAAIHRPGKAAAGRLLDGVEHNGFPA